MLYHQARALGRGVENPPTIPITETISRYCFVGGNRDEQNPNNARWKDHSASSRVMGGEL